MKISQIAARRIRRWHWTAFATSAVLICIPLRAQTLFSAASIGSLGADRSIPSGINNSTQIVGQSYTTLSPGVAIAHAFLYSGGAIHDLGTFGGSDSGATGINSSGQVVGVANTTGNLAAHAFLYNGGPLIDLGTFGGTTSSANAINDSGQIVGQSFTGSTTFHAFLYSGGTMSDLGTLGGTDSEAFGINNTGQIVGAADTTVSISRAFLYSGGVMHDLGTLGGTSSAALAINNAGQVAGSAATASGSAHAFFYDGAMHDLGTLAGTSSVATGINSGGEIVGYYSLTSSVNRAFLYSSGVMSDLNNLLMPGSLASGIYLAAASGINDHGQIVAAGSDGLAYLLSPHAASTAPSGPPTISGIVNGADFAAGAPVETGSWVAIFGTNLAPAGDSRKWNSSTEIVNGILPASLDGTSVTVDGKAAAVEYISPGQVNIQPPDDAALGPVQVVVTTAAGPSPPFSVNYAQFAPGLFPASAPYLAAQHADNSYVGGYPGSTPAKPGEVIILWGTGFGPASPAVPAGKVFTGANPLANVSVTIGGQPATVDFAGVVGAGLVQINVHVPLSIGNGDAPVVAMVGGVSTQTTANMIAVQQ